MANIQRPAHRSAFSVLSDSLVVKANPDQYGPEFSSTGTWQGFAVPEDPKMKKLADESSWFDIPETGSNFSTPFEQAKGGAHFPFCRDEEKALERKPHEEEASVGDENDTFTAPSSPTSSLEPVCAVGCPSTAIAAEEEEEVQEDKETEEVTPFEPEVVSTPSAVDPVGCQRHESYALQAQGQELVQQEQQEEIPTTQQQQQQQCIEKANYELEGHLPFIPYGTEAMENELPKTASAETLRAPHAVQSKLFFGHLWGGLATGSLQWLVDTFVPRHARAPKHLLYAPQLHYRGGWFKGCLHAALSSYDPTLVQQALHHRVLFDLHGVWYAETPEQQQKLQEYCRLLRNMPQSLRHSKLRGLPCNPMACEYAQNE